MYGSGELPLPLSSEEIDGLFLKAKEGDVSASLLIKEHNLRLVISIASKYPNYAEHFDDLVSVGNIGLLKAVETFKTDKKVKFSTYAGTCINNEILMYIRNLSKKNLNNISIEEEIGHDKDGNTLKIEELLYDVNAYVDDIIEHCELENTVREAVMKLNDLERKVIILRYYLYDGTKRVTQAMAGKELGYSRSYISRLENAAKKKIKKHVIERGYM